MIAPRYLGWGLAAIWAVAALAGALALRTPLVYVATMAVAAGAVGLCTGYVLDRAGAHRTGGLIGHVLLVPPATKLAYWGASASAEMYSSLALPVFGAAFAVISIAVLCAGSALGMTLEALLRVIHRRLFPRLTMPAGWWRPRWRTVRIAALLAALLGAVAYADRKVGLPLPEATPPSASNWLEREKSLFREVLAGHKYAVVVLPVQVEEPSFDRIERSLMTRYLSRRVEERTGSRLPDPTLLARAFGARGRQLDLTDALALSEALGARTAVASRVQRAGQVFRVRAAIWTRADQGGWRETAAATLEKLPFGDRLPPSVTFRDALDPMLDTMRLGAASAAPARTPAGAEPAPPIDNLLRLATYESATAAGRALQLQLLAMLHERESLAAETLWERSLLALWRVEEGAEFDRVLEARAYLHLARRPYALERLGRPESPAGRALLAALNGDVPAAEAAAGAIGDRVLRLASEIELADLYEAYNLYKRLRVRRAELLKEPWTDAAALGFRLSAGDWFTPEVHHEVAAALGPVAAVSVDWREVAAMWLRWAYWRPDPLGPNELRLARSIERRYAPIWKAKAADWPSRQAADRIAEWDYYDLQFAMNRRALLKTVHSTLSRQALPEQAEAIIDALGSYYQGYPRLMYYHAWALDRVGRKALPGTQQRLYSKSSALAVSAYGWEGGESPLSAAVEHYTYERRYRKYLDEPLRWYRASVPSERLGFDRVSFGAQEIEREITAARRRLQFADRHALPLRDLVRWLRRAGRMEEALAVVEESRNRFVGTAARAELLAEASETARRGADPMPAFRELLELDPDSWDARSRLAKAYFESGKIALAQETWLAFPGFANHEGQNVVGLSNRAFEAGYHFYRRGEARSAVPLFALSTSLRTGSAREIHSRELLAVMENDMDSALKWARYQVDRYNDGNAAMRQILYLFLLGRDDRAWGQFPVYANRFGTEEVWAAAFIAHRMQGLEGRALENWLAQAAQRDTRRDYLAGALRERHAFMAVMIDRAPSDEALQFVRRVVQANNRSPFYPQAAEGYAAFRKGDFAGAAQKLRGVHDDLFNIGVTRRHSMSEWLPYLVLAYARSGRPKEADKLLADQLNNLGIDADYLAASALLEGAAGKHAAAEAALRLAFHRLPRQATRSLPPGYTLLEACELLLKETGNDVYRELIEDLARRLQVDLPHAWAAAFEAKYARDPDTRHLALAAASILDPRSERLAQFPEAERLTVQRAAVRHDSLLGAALRAAQR